MHKEDSGTDLDESSTPRFFSWHETWAPGIVSIAAKRPKKLLAIYGVIAAWAIYTAPAVFDKCSTDASPPRGSPAEKAEEMMKLYFPADATSVNGILYVETLDGSSLTDETNPALREITAKTQAHFETASDAVPYACTVTSYYTLMEQHLFNFAQEYITASQSGAIVTITHSPGDVDSEKLGIEMMNFVEKLKEDACCTNLWLGASGNPVVDAESNIAALEDLESADLIVIPLAMAVLAYMLNSPRLLVVTLINFVTALTLAFSVVYYNALAGLSTSSATPGIMQSVLMAVSIDYSLFMLTRFVEELRSGAKYEKAVEGALMSAGHTVLGSGSTLMLAFLSLCLFPIALFVSLALGVVFAIFFAIFVNLTLTPILLLSFPGFFSKLGWQWCGPNVVASAREPEIDPEVSDASPQATKVPFGYKFAQWTTKPSTSVLVCVVLVLFSLLLFPLTVGVTQSADVSQEVPRGSDAILALGKVEKAFGGGMLQPYSVLIAPKDGGVGSTAAIFNLEFWTAASDVLNRIPSQFPSEGRNSVLSPMYQYGTGAAGLDMSGLPDQRYQIELWRQCHKTFDMVVPSWWTLPNPSPCKPGADCCSKTFSDPTARHMFKLNSDEEVYQMAAQLVAILDMTTNDQGSAVRAQVSADFELGSTGNIDFAKNTRIALTRDWGAVNVWLANGDTDNADMLESIHEWAPVICMLTMTVILVLIGVLYRSVMIPVRGIITIMCTQIAAFAILTAVYCRGNFDWMGIAALKKVGGVFFLVPPMTFVIVLGLSLDYDVFLIGRIVEFRRQGFSDTDAIELGVYKTSGIITAAGVIMMIAFSGQLLSRMYLLNELGCVLVTAVALDTLFLRALATPALMAPLGAANWWPAKMPPVTENALEFVQNEESFGKATPKHSRVNGSPGPYKTRYSSLDTGDETGDE